MQVRSLRWRIAPSALHVPWLATRFAVGALWKGRGRLSPWRRKHIVASYCALALGLFWHDFDYCRVTATRAPGSRAESDHDAMNRVLNADPPPLPALALSADDDAPRRRLPFSKWQPFPVRRGRRIWLAPAVQCMPGQRYSAMLGAFIYLVPVLCGAVTVYVAERSERRSWGYYIVAPWVATALFVSGTLLVYIEGIICAIVIVPMFATMGSLGGLVMGMVCRVTNWPKQAIYSFAMLPLVLGALEPMLPEPDLYSATTRTLFVAAPPERIWHELNDVQNIRRARSATRGPGASVCRCQWPA